MLKQYENPYAKRLLKEKMTARRGVLIAGMRPPTVVRRDDGGPNLIQLQGNPKEIELGRNNSYLPVPWRS